MEIKHCILKQRDVLEVHCWTEHEPYLMDFAIRKLNGDISKEFTEARYKLAMDKWQSSVKTYPVHESNYGKFLKLIAHRVYESLEKGISIPPKMVEIKEAPVPECYPDKAMFAFLKEDKEETQEDLWEEVHNFVIDWRYGDINTQDLKDHLIKHFEIKRK